MAGPLTKSKDLEDIAGTGGNDSGPGVGKKNIELTIGNDSGLGVRKKNFDCTTGNDSGLGEDALLLEDIVAASGPKLMFRCQN